MVKQIKQLLLENTDLIQELLEELGCHSFKQYTRKLCCALPDGDNDRSLQVYYNDFLKCRLWTRAGFKDYEIQDIISVFQYLMNKKYHQTISFLCGRLNIDCSEYVEYKTSDAIKKIKLFKKTPHTQNTHNHIDEDVLLLKTKTVVEDWVNEGISADTQKEFDVFIDKKEKRWMFPVRDENGNIVAYKGRTYVEDYKLFRIPKYLYIPSLGVNDILFNIHKALPYIEEKNEIIIVEAEKSVMKLWQNNVKNCVAISTKIINPLLVRKILQIKCANVVIALDEGVAETEIKEEVKKLKAFKNVWYMFDNEKLLRKKDAPIDSGIDIWYHLYNNRIRG